jgi:hypothetical protein
LCVFIATPLYDRAQVERHPLDTFELAVLVIENRKVIAMSLSIRKSPKRSNQCPPTIRDIPSAPYLGPKPA